MDLLIPGRRSSASSRQERVGSETTTSHSSCHTDVCKLQTQPGFSGSSRTFPTILRTVADSVSLV